MNVISSLGNFSGTLPELLRDQHLQLFRQLRRTPDRDTTACLDRQAPTHSLPSSNPLAGPLQGRYHPALRWYLPPTRAEARSVTCAVEREDLVACSDQLSPDRVAHRPRWRARPGSARDQLAAAVRMSWRDWRRNRVLWGCRSSSLECSSGCPTRSSPTAPRAWRCWSMAGLSSRRSTPPTSTPAP